MSHPPSDQSTMSAMGFQSSQDEEVEEIVVEEGQNGQQVAENQVSETRVSRRRKTSHLKDVPDTREQRERIRQECAAYAVNMDRSKLISKDEMEVHSHAVLNKMGLSEAYLGWTMVLLASEFWRDQVASVPFERRLLLLPHCLKHAEGCPADYDEFGLDCKECGACSIADYRTVAEELGYKVLVAEGSPIVLKIIISGYVDAIVGVACLNVLEKAIDKILAAGIPCIAVPLLSSDCRNTSVDEDWVKEMIHVQREIPAEKTKTYLHLMRLASGMFEPDELERLSPRLRGGKRLDQLNGQGLAGLEPIATTEAVAFDFLAKGGKYSRPFLTLATYDALSGSTSTGANGSTSIDAIPDHVRRTALSIETFHKASLVHDDIEDDDSHRYGDPTLHMAYGIPTAINIGDFLIGMGYRLVSRDAGAMGAEAAADILDCLADAHLRLSEGQGAELAWRDARNKKLSPLDALKIYALKTAPAFEAAMYCGARLAGPTDKYKDAIRQFAKHVGIGFQILNDLKDWQENADNKMDAGGDVLGGRPTILLALALEKLEEKDAQTLLELISQDAESASIDATATIQKVRALYVKAGVFEMANRLVDKHHARAEEIVEQIEPEAFQQLAFYMIANILERPEETTPDLVPLTLSMPS